MSTSGLTWFYFFLYGRNYHAIFFWRASASPQYHPNPFFPLREAVAPAQWKQKIIRWVFPRLEKADSHGFPMEQRSGEIESTTKHYTNKHTHIQYINAYKQTQMCILTAIQRNTRKPPIHIQLHSTFSGRWTWSNNCTSYETASHVILYWCLNFQTDSRYYIQWLTCSVPVQVGKYSIKN